MGLPLLPVLSRVTSWVVVVTRLDFWVHGVPAPQGSKKHVGRGVMVESSAKVKPWREAVKWAALEAIGTMPTDGSRFAISPLRVEVMFVLPRPRGHYRTGKNAHLLRDAAPRRPAAKPDIDKLIRSTFDAMSDARVWRDDSLVVTVLALKVYETPGRPVGARVSVDVAVTDGAA